MNRYTSKLLSCLLAFLLFMPLLSAFAEEADTGEEAAEENFFAGLELTYLNGDPFDASVFSGKPLLLNIWATWCQPCVEELPHLDELAKEYAEQITIVGLHSDGLTVTEAGELAPNGEMNQAALELAEALALTFPLINPDINLFILMNDPEYGLQVEFLPTTWLIDGDGYVRRILPSSLDMDGWKNTIDEFLTKLQEEADAGTES